ncbi:MmcQ/YjbR family DNA-binding protein [Sanyastnella coralliicola]|uniref:MmcQ/YjbR family DNA-binding protein n=1 Tax=Sanyastnella coralliicola TaxID=3069118 RepID=UPI0027BA725E|nr:MmcQ/YjbR family DNA-binding protein [Longitalea sp. SCSIO 12813]
MNIETFREFCLKLPAVTESFPFDNKTLVFKVAGKMFALCDVDSFEGVNLKCDPDMALELRETYSAVRPGYHMSKKHWNTVDMDGSIPPKLFEEWVLNSYHLVIKGLTKKQRMDAGL